MLILTQLQQIHPAVSLVRVAQLALQKHRRPQSCVLQHIHHSYSMRDTIELGRDIEFLHGPSAPGKSVITHGDWVIAWDCLVDTTLFIFKHRRQELQLYGKHVQQFFTSLPSQFHVWVINYDRAVQIQTAPLCDLELSDFSEFTNLQIQWIHSPSGQSSGQPAESKSKQNMNHCWTTACQRWNDKKCPNAASNCNYLHVCSKCSNRGHIANDCNLSKK